MFLEKLRFLKVNVRGGVEICLIFSMYVCYVCMYVCMHVCMLYYVCMYACMCVVLCMYYVCMHTCMGVPLCAHVNRGQKLTIGVIPWVPYPFSETGSLTVK